MDIKGQGGQRNLRPMAFWVVFCASGNCAGWGLSAIRQLNTAAYVALFILAAILFFVLRRRIFPDGCACCHWPKLRRCFGRAFPLAFLILATLAILGGVLHPPTNYDGLAYRTPRVLHWLAEGRWHWIHTEFQRLNARAPGFEWIAAPIIVLTRTDRFLFLINVISFLLMPGLVFSVFTRLGVRSRVAWHWMWLVPSGYCFLLQAGSIGNDMIGAVFVMAAVDFALRARQSNRISDVWLSCLAAALATSSKASNIPLMLPWLVALLPSIKLLRSKLPATVGIALACLAASLLPQAVLNYHYCGDWAGLKAEGIEAYRAQPMFRFANNVVLLTIQNFVPPVFPFGSAWDRAVSQHLSSALRDKLEHSFEPGGAHWSLGELQIEEAAGLGLGVSALAVVTCFSAIVHRRSVTKRPRVSLVVACTWISLFVFMTKSGLSSVARIITPYYALLLPAFLLFGNQSRLLRARWWRGAGWLVFAMAAALLVLSPARPLWPANTLLAHADSSPHPLLKRAKTVYSVYAGRANGFAPARQLLPPDLRILGFITFDDPETSLWRPFFHRRIMHVTHEDSRKDLDDRHIEYLLANADKFERLMRRPLDQWLIEMHGEVVSKISLPLRATWGPSDWVLIRLE